MYQYRILRRAGGLVQRALIAAGCFLAITIVLQLLILILAVYSLHNWFGYILLVALIVPILCFIGWVIMAVTKKSILRTTGFKLSSSASHGELKKYLQHLISCTKRLSSLSVLSDAQASGIRQKADDLDNALHHHPLNEDLIREIARAREDVIGPVFGTLDDIRRQITASKARAVAQDIYQPPFPVVTPFVVAYHQFTHISEITDLYLSRPTMNEYYIVHHDVWQIMTKGDFLRYGQRLYSGINTNSHILGRLADDLGHAFSIVWLTHAFSQAAANRCCTLHDWNLRDAIRDMQRQILPCLEKTRDTLLNDMMPILKRRIRTYTPAGNDPDEYIRNATEAFIKAVDSVVATLKAAELEEGAAARTSPGLVVSHYSEEEPEQSAGPGTPGYTPITHQPTRSHKRRRSHRRSQSSKDGFIKQLFKMLKPSK